MNKLMIFEGKEVEVFEFEGKVLFNPRHVGECLDIVDVNVSMRGFSDKQKIKLTNSDECTTLSRKLNNAGENFLTEAGVYKLIFQSRKEEAEKFQDWITDEVIPSIRNKGSYDIVEEEINKIQDPKEKQLSLEIYGYEKLLKVNPTDSMANIMINQKKQDLVLYKQSKEIQEVKEEQKLIKGKIDIVNDYEFAVVGYASMHGLNLPHKTAVRLGRLAAKISRDEGYTISTTSHPTWGRINTYHIDVLDKVFELEGY